MQIERWMPEFVSRVELAQFCRNLRSKLYPEFGYPLDIELIAEKKLNLHIIPIAGIRALIGIDAFLRSDFSGIVVDNDEFLEDRFQNRLRFSIAHEVGHFLLHRAAYRELGIRTADEYIHAIQNLSERAYGALEWQSNQFAGLVLVPREELVVSVGKARHLAEKRALTGKLKDEPGQLLALVASRISRDFGVSDEVIDRRVRDEHLWPYGRGQ